MSYEQFSIEKVFLDETHNILCNRMYNVMEELASSSSVTLDNVFCITGTVARIIQGAPVQEVDTISFITSSDTLFTAIQATDFSKSFPEANVIKFKSAVQFTVPGFGIEIIKEDTVANIKTESNLRVQDTASIPAYII
ncbi:MAG: hypothetical protein CMM93_08645 [Rickettsiales bacterium]|nr:hypothetical protein [Rickettsiales bacterium]